MIRSSFKPPARPARVRAFPSAAPLGQRRAVMARCDAPSDPGPKSVPRRNPNLLSMADGKPCLLLVPSICRGETETTVACHSNLLAHGKGKGRKADDHYTVWGCGTCHRWLDSGRASYEEKENVFMAAHLRQVLAWRQIAADSRKPSKDRAAVLWALGLLNATEIAPI